MARYNTGNPIDSNAMKDLSDNAQNLDVLVNSRAKLSNPDRFGVERKTWYSMERDFDASQSSREQRFSDALAAIGYQFFGDYAAGIVLNEYNQIVRDSNGDFWRVSGTVDLPYTLTGAGVDEGGALVSVGDATLRSQLGASGGVQLVENSVIGIANLGQLGSATWLNVGDVITVGIDNAQHQRRVSAVNDGTGVMVGAGKYANIIPQEGEIKASWLGMTGGADYTTLFNTQLPPYLASAEIRSIVLDTGDVRVNAVLDYAYNKVTFSGKGSLLTDNRANMLQNKIAERTELRTFSGPLVTGAVYNENFKNAIKSRGVVRVVLLGDSISVGLDRFSDGTIPEGSSLAQGVDNYDRQTSFAEQVYAALLAALPSGTVLKFYNRSIGGMSYGQLATAWDTLNGTFSGREQATAGKAWRDTVLDLEPDLVIHAMGMNATAVSNTLDFNNLWYNYIYTKRKVKKFDQALVTTPNPNFISANQFGDFRSFDNNASKMYVAHTQRALARRFGITLIDVAKLSTIKRYGFDPTTCVYSNTAHSVSTTVVLNKGGILDITPRQMPLFSSTAVTFKVTSIVTVLDFKIECGSVTVQFDGTTAYVYEAVPLAALSPGKTTPFVIDLNASYTVTLTVSPSSVTLYKGDVPIVQITRGFVSDTAGLRVINSNFSGAGTSVDVISTSVRESVHPRYSVNLETNGEMYGKLEWAQNTNGGGVNHPSTYGIVEVYAPPIIEFASKLVSVQAPEASAQIGAVPSDILMYVGKLSRVSTGFARISIVSHNADTVLDLRVHLGPFGSSESYRVDHYTNTSEGSLYIDSDLCVYIKKSDGLLYIETGGQWDNVGIFKYPAGTAPVGTLIPVPATEP